MEEKLKLIEELYDITVRQEKAINLGLILLSFISFSLINKFYYNIYADNELVEIFIVAAPYLFAGVGILLLLISIARIYFIHLKKYRILRKRFDLNDTCKDKFKEFVSLSTQKHVQNFLMKIHCQNRS